MSNPVTRRGFLAGCSAAIAGLSGARFGSVAFAEPGVNTEILVLIFLRGGMDGLHFMPPLAGADRGYYEALRPTLRIPTSGAGAALDLDGRFGLHPAAAPLYDLYQNGSLAIIQAAGMPIVNRSHFEAMEYIELGTPGAKAISTGWLTRHLQSAANLPAEIIMPSLAVGDLQPTSLLGDYEAINLGDPSSFNLGNGPWLWQWAQRTALRELYEGDTTWLHTAGVQALDAADIVELNVDSGYTPANGAVYPESDFGNHLEVLAQMIKLDLGLQVATVDYGGWDTHEAQGEGSGGFFAGLLGDLAAGLGAFYTDLDGSGGGHTTQRLTVVVQSEFGRELRENSDSGTEHGYGNLMLVLGGNAIGGIHGSWPGLAPGQLVDGTDVAVTTDYRRVLSEVLIRRLGNPRLDTIFPGYTGYTPLGVVAGEDLPLTDIFSDGFESGDLSAWSSST